MPLEHGSEIAVHHEETGSAKLNNQQSTRDLLEHKDTCTVLVHFCKQ